MLSVLGSKLATCITRVSRSTISELGRPTRRIVIGSPSRSQMELDKVVKALETLSPTNLAETWDNVGLLVEPSSPHVVTTLLMTNDLTEDVLDEANERQANFILSYHPPLFKSIKRLTSNNWKERCIVRCLERRIAVYSPHTSWDTFNGGINDWLARAFRKCPEKFTDLPKAIKRTKMLRFRTSAFTFMPMTLETTAVQPITPYLQSSDFTHHVSLDVPPDFRGQEDILDKISQTITTSGTDQLHLNHQDPDGSYRLAFSCKEPTLRSMAQLLQNSPLLPLLRITKLEKVPLSQTGTGRLCILQQPLPLSEVVQIIKGHLNLSHLRLAMGRGKKMQEKGVAKVAICAGSGSSVLCHVAADVYWTGEMSHHDVLDAVHRGTSVVLCEHTNTERGFLTHLAPKINQLLQNKVNVIISSTDRDPLTVV